MRLLVICACLISCFSAYALAGSATDDLYKAVLTTTPTDLPSGISVVTMKSITDIDNDAKAAGLTNEVEIKLAGGDDKTFVNYYFFSSSDAAAAWDKQYFGDSHPGKELPSPTGAQCSNFANGTGYCDFVAPDLAVLITSRGPATTAERLMKSAYDNLMAVAKKQSSQH